MQFWCEASVNKFAEKASSSSPAVILLANVFFWNPSTVFFAFSSVVSVMFDVVKETFRRLSHAWIHCMFSGAFFMYSKSIRLSPPNRRLHGDIFASRKSSTFTNWHGIWRQLVSLTLFLDVSFNSWLMVCTTQWKIFNTMENVQRCSHFGYKVQQIFSCFSTFLISFSVMLFNFLLFTSIHLHLKLKDII